MALRTGRRRIDQRRRRSMPKYETEIPPANRRRHDRDAAGHADGQGPRRTARSAAPRGVDLLAGTTLIVDEAGRDHDFYPQVLSDGSELGRSNRHGQDGYLHCTSSDGATSTVRDRYGPVESEFKSPLGQSITGHGQQYRGPRPRCSPASRGRTSSSACLGCDRGCRRWLGAGRRRSRPTPCVSLLCGEDRAT